MNPNIDGHDSHIEWLEDVEYRKEFGSECAKLEIAAALVRARDAMKITQSELAGLVGTSQAYIARLERGDANPTIGNVGRLFACMWLKPTVDHSLLESSTSIESVIIENMARSEESVERSKIFQMPNSKFKVRING